jgi:hypothetical protein
VLEDLPDGDRGLAVPPELGPVAGHRIIERELAAVGQLVHEHRHERLPGGEQQEQVIVAAAEALLEHDLAAAQQADLSGRTPRLDQADDRLQGRSGYGNARLASNSTLMAEISASRAPTRSPCPRQARAGMTSDSGTYLIPRTPLGAK